MRAPLRFPPKKNSRFCCISEVLLYNDYACVIADRYIMSMQDRLEMFINTNRDGIKMALVHGNLDEAIKVIFSAGYDSGINDAFGVDSYTEGD